MITALNMIAMHMPRQPRNGLPASGPFLLHFGGGDIKPGIICAVCNGDHYMSSNASSLFQHAATALACSFICTGRRTRQPGRAVICVSFALPTAVLVGDSCTNSSDCQNDPDPDHGRDDRSAVSARVVVVGDHRYKTSNPRADSHANPRHLGPARRQRRHRRAGGRAGRAEPSVDPFVDLRADPIDEALRDRAVIIAAKFAMCCRCGGDVIPSSLFHGITIHRKYRVVHQPERRSVRSAHRPAGF
jgi:hypothetical protein